MLGTTERYEDSVILLARQIGWPLAAMIDRPRNVTGGDTRGDQPSAATRDLIADMNRHDLLLCHGAEALLDCHVNADKRGFADDRSLFDRLSTLHREGAGYTRLLAIEKVERGTPPPRLQYF
jgi:hypothetical protein